MNDIDADSEPRVPSPRAESTMRALDRVAESLARDARFSAFVVARPHPLLVMVRSGEAFVLIASAAVWDGGRELLRPYADQLASAEARLVLLGRPSDPDLAQAIERGVGALLPAEPAPEELFVSLQQAFEIIELKTRSESRGKWLNRYRYELGELIEIARALTTEREIDKLLGLILEKSRLVTSADAGSVYVVEGAEPELTRRRLRFKLSQNDSVSFDSREFTMPISPRSMAGYVAIEKQTLRIDDAYEMPPGAPFGFDRSFDEKVGYRTRSMVCTPLVSSQGEVIGVLQLLNKKQDFSRKLLVAEDFERQVIPFDERSAELLETLAAQAGIALENAILYEEIRTIFEGFVKASVEAIEARDPTTSGHSRRVAELTVGLARAVDRQDAGPYKDVKWKREELREIEYASLLHDFGKIGVRENVLVKAKKLFPHDLDSIRHRFDFVARGVEVGILKRKLDAIERGAGSGSLAELDQELAVRLAELDEAWRVIESANEPTVLAAGDFQCIEELGRVDYPTRSGEPATLLTSDEVKSLSVMRGSLTEQEIAEIRSHVSHTYRFLSKIPWGKTFARVAVIAGAHHERLNGTGYPNRLRAEEIPLQSKMMTISDIFDALTASDRPYKRAVPVERALDILGFEARDEHVDAELLRVFIEARAWESVVRAP